MREALSGHADEMAERLLKLCRKDYGDDPRMAAVVGRALEAYFDRIGVGVLPMKPLEPGEMTPVPEMSQLSDAQLSTALVN